MALMRMANRSHRAWLATTRRVMLTTRVANPKHTSRTAMPVLNAVACGACVLLAFFGDWDPFGSGFVDPFLPMNDPWLRLSDAFLVEGTLVIARLRRQNTYTMTRVVSPPIVPATTPAINAISVPPPLLSEGGVGEWLGEDGAGLSESSCAGDAPVGGGSAKGGSRAVGGVGVGGGGGVGVGSGGVGGVGVGGGGGGGVGGVGVGGGGSVGVGGGGVGVGGGGGGGQVPHTGNKLGGISLPLAKFSGVEVLTEAAGISEHRPHICHLACVPAPDVLVEAAGIIVHEAHIGNLAGVPAADVLVKAGSPLEHGLHICHLACVPAPDVLVEAAGRNEHEAHVSHLAGVPAADVLVEAAGKTEHGPHVSHLAGVPAADVLVEVAGKLEHARHVSHLAGVPAADVLVEAVALSEHGKHVRDPARAGGGRVGRGNLQARALGIHHAVDCPRFPKTCVWAEHRHPVGMQREGGGRPLRCDDPDHGDPRTTGRFPSRTSGCTVPSRVHRWRPRICRVSVPLVSTCALFGSRAGRAFARASDDPCLHTRALRVRVVRTTSDPTLSSRGGIGPSCGRGGLLVRVDVYSCPNRRRTPIPEASGSSDPSEVHRGQGQGE
eukprot:scaffold754_cov289-Pavlova_lutheri.AAC.9